MKKLEIILTSKLEQEIAEVIKMKSYGDCVTKEKDVILKVWELYTCRYKNIVKGSITAIENATRKE